MSGEAAHDANAEITLGADKGYDAQEFIEASHDMAGTPRAQKDCLEGRLRHSAARARVDEQGSGWAETVGCMRQGGKWDQMFVLNLVAYHLVRMRFLTLHKAAKELNSR